MLRRGVYALNEPWARQALHPFVAANALQRASYVSRQSALRYHGLIPEEVPVVTSVSRLRPEAMSTPIGSFDFRHIKREMFFGYTEIEVVSGQNALIARPEKALIDLIYLTPFSDKAGYLEELRLEWEAGFDGQAFQTMVAQTGSRKIERAAQLLLELKKSQGQYTTL